MIPNSQPYVAVIRERQPHDPNFDMLRYVPIVGWTALGVPVGVWDSELCSVKNIPGYERIIVRSVALDGINGIEVPNVEIAKRMAAAKAATAKPGFRDLLKAASGDYKP